MIEEIKINKGAPGAKGDSRIAKDMNIQGYCPKCKRTIRPVQTVDRYKDVYGHESALVKHWCPDHNIILRSQTYPIGSPRGPKIKELEARKRREEQARSCKNRWI